MSNIKEVYMEALEDEDLDEAFAYSNSDAYEDYKNEEILSLNSR